jgi:spore germination protein GerM
LRRLLIAAAVTLALLSAEGCRSKTTAPGAAKTSDRILNREIQVFYESPRLSLVPERRKVPLPENDAAALAGAIRELLKGPRTPAVGRLLPPDAVLRAAYLLPDGNAIIDLGGPTLTAGWNTGSHNEMMAAYSIVQTASANFPEIRRVRILVNGQVAPTLGGHLRLDRALEPAPELVAVSK